MLRSASLLLGHEPVLKTILSFFLSLDIDQPQAQILKKKEMPIPAHLLPLPKSRHPPWNQSTTGSRGICPWCLSVRSVNSPVEKTRARSKTWNAAIVRSRLKNRLFQSLLAKILILFYHHLYFWLDLLSFHFPSHCRTVHFDCQMKLSELCDFGEYSQFIIPPNSVTAKPARTVRHPRRWIISKVKK